MQLLGNSLSAPRLPQKFCWKGTICPEYSQRLILLDHRRPPPLTFNMLFKLKLKLLILIYPLPPRKLNKCKVVPVTVDLLLVG